MTESGVCKASAKRQQNVGQLVGSLGVVLLAGFYISSASQAEAQSQSQMLGDLSAKCSQFLLKFDGRRAFEGATYHGFHENTVMVSEAGALINLWGPKNRGFGARKKCAFEAYSVTKTDFGFFAAKLFSDMEEINMKRIRPFTETNFSFAGCIDAKVGTREMTVSALYRSKKEGIIFTAVSKIVHSDNCSEKGN